jgi:hypothetical protein
MPSFAAPTQQEIDTAAQRMRSPELAAYFLSRLQNPKWIGPLSERGIFANPPPTGHWPASSYLARMAKLEPSQVADVFGNIQPANASVVRDMIDAAMAMPTKVAVKLVANIGRASKAGALWMNFKSASELCVRLADSAETTAALVLADVLFTPKVDDPEEPNRRDVYWYKDGLKNVVPVFVSRVPKVFLVRLCNWLKVSMESTKRVELGSGDDDSCWWRPAIEDHEQNHDYDLVGELVGFLRQGLEAAVSGGHLSFEDAIAIVERYPYLVFKRLRLHLINTFADRRTDLAKASILDRGLFDDHEFKHEYALLIGNRLNLLSSEEKAMWFGWIDAGPDMAGFDESVMEGLNRSATEQDRQARIQYWQFEKLHCVRDHLDGDRRRFYEQMLAEHGVPELADLNVRFKSGWGVSSPMTVEHLSGMTFHEAVEKVSSWKPGKRGFMTPDIEGLGSTFEQYVATSPEEFSTKADVLVGRPAIYVRGFIEQMGQAVASNHGVDIDAVLALCEWVIGRPVEERTTPASERDALVDTDWQWARDAITRFVQRVLKATDGGGPKYALQKYRKPLWGLLEQLCRDRAESYVVRDVSRVDPRLYDYLLLGINSPRGKAVEAAMEYLRWVANHVKQVNGNAEVVAGGFDALPEFREMLEWQISPENRSVEAMAVVGSRITLINWVDAGWLQTNADRLFDLPGIEREPPEPCGWSAWNSFLVWVSPHVDYYQTFRPQFAYAVKQAAKVEFDDDIQDQPMDHLGRHLVVLYGRGQLGLDEDGGVMRNLVTRANPEIRRRTIGFVGQSLEDSDQVPAEVIERFKALWEVYWKDIGKSDAAGRPGSWLFGPWFSCGHFPDDWAMEQLEQFVEVSPIVEPDHEVIEQLATLADNNLARAVRILERMVKGDQEGWRIYGWTDDAKEILDKAMRTKSEARDIATRLIDYLGRRGYTQLGDLLN